MRKRMIILLILLLLAVSATVAFASGPAQVIPTDVLSLPDHMPIEGSSAQLVINDAGATIQINTSGLPAGHAVTLWMVAFNYPDACSDGVCGPDDAFPPPGNAAAGASVRSGGGHVIGSSGRASFGARFPAGRDGTPWAVGLIEPRTAEYHFVLRTHGPADPDIVQDQISTPNANCSNFGGSGDYPCEDLQVVIFTDTD